MLSGLVAVTLLAGFAARRPAWIRRDTGIYSEVTREQAGDRFGSIWAFGTLGAILSHLLDVPQPIRTPIGIVLLAVLAYYGTAWLRFAVRDGTIRRGLPDYGWAFLSLLIIAATWAVITPPVLLVLGEEITATAVSTGAFLGVLVTLIVWWALQGRRARAAGR